MVIFRTVDLDMKEERYYRHCADNGTLCNTGVEALVVIRVESISKSRFY